MATAAELFATEGYARTTFAKIAAAAGVSTETVQGQGPKAALLIAAIEYAAFAVSDEKNVLNLDVGRRLNAIDRCEEALDFLAAAQTDVHQRTAQLALALIGGAGADPELDKYLNDVLAGINLQTRRVLGAFRDRGWLRVDLPFDEIVETTAVICSVDTYLRITHRDGWSVDAYQSMVSAPVGRDCFRVALEGERAQNTVRHRRVDRGHARSRQKRGLRP